jgi:hypothetical protein
VVPHKCPLGTAPTCLRLYRSVCVRIVGKMSKYLYNKNIFTDSRPIRVVFRRIVKSPPMQARSDVTFGHCIVSKFGSTPKTVAIIELIRQSTTFFSSSNSYVW